MNTTKAIQQHYQKQFNTQTHDNLITHTPSHTILEITDTHILIITPTPETWNTLIRTNFHTEYQDQISQRNQNSILNHLRRNHTTQALELADPKVFNKIDQQLKRTK